MRTFRLFISHSWSYADDYYRLTRLLSSRPYFSYDDYSIPRDDPVHTSGTEEALYKAILRRLRPCDLVLVMAGMYSTYSSSIELEVEAAAHGFSDPKPIIAVIPWGQKQVSSVATRYADDVVGWNTESIVAAIRSYAPPRSATGR